MFFIQWKCQYQHKVHLNSWRTLGGHLGNCTLGGHSGILCRGKLKQLGYSDTRTLRAIRHLCTQGALFSRFISSILDIRRWFLAASNQTESFSTKSRSYHSFFVWLAALFCSCFDELFHVARIYKKISEKKVFTWGLWLINHVDGENLFIPLLFKESIKHLFEGDVGLLEFKKAAFLHAVKKFLYLMILLKEHSQVWDHFCRLKAL